MKLLFFILGYVNILLLLYCLQLFPPCLANTHIKTHLWDLSTNLSKLNIFLKLKKLYYMKVKYITTTNKHFSDVSLPLDDEMKLKAWHYQH